MPTIKPIEGNRTQSKQFETLKSNQDIQQQSNEHWNNQQTTQCKQVQPRQTNTMIRNQKYSEASQNQQRIGEQTNNQNKSKNVNKQSNSNKSF